MQYSKIEFPLKSTLCRIKIIWELFDNAIIIYIAWRKSLLTLTIVLFLIPKPFLRYLFNSLTILNEVVKIFKANLFYKF